MRKRVILSLAIGLSIIAYLFTVKPNVSIVTAYYDGGTAQIIVNKLPFLKSKKIQWWNENKDNIMQKYNIPSGQNTPFQITIYAFGDGYKEEGKEDRRCFSEITSPKNCIDKNIIMSIRQTRNGSIKYDF